jgi:hypothetical protein
LNGHESLVEWTDTTKHSLPWAIFSCCHFHFSGKKGKGKEGKKSEREREERLSDQNATIVKTQGNR